MNGACFFLKSSEKSVNTIRLSVNPLGKKEKKKKSPISQNTALLKLMRILNFMGADNKINAGTWEGLWYLQTKRGKKVTTRWKGGNVTVCLWWWHLDVIKCHRETRKKNKLFIHHWLASTSYNIFIYSFLKHKPLIKEQLTPKSNIWDWDF